MPITLNENQIQLPLEFSNSWTPVKLISKKTIDQFSSLLVAGIILGDLLGRWHFLVLLWAFCCIPGLQIAVYARRATVARRVENTSLLLRDKEYPACLMLESFRLFHVFLLPVFGRCVSVQGGCCYWDMSLWIVPGSDIWQWWVNILLLHREVPFLHFPTGSSLLVSVVSTDICLIFVIYQHEHLINCARLLQHGATEWPRMWVFLFTVHTDWVCLHNILAISHDSEWNKYQV